MSTEKKGVEASFKSMDTEEFLDIHFNRPIGYVWALFFQRFYAFVQERYGDNIPQELRDEFRALSLPLMKYTNILTFNTRAIALYISLLIGEPWLYFIFEMVVMTSLFVYMRRRHEALCAYLYHKYAK